VLAAAGDGSEAADATLVSQAQGSAREAFLSTRYGGGEIIEAIGDIAKAPRYDAGKAHRLADAVTGRDRQVQFEIFTDRVLALLASAAAEAAGEGQAARAAALAQAWQGAEQRITETEDYNLDRRQGVVGLLKVAHDALAHRS
jgi:DNA polymerase-3 subunit delta'